MKRNFWNWAVFCFALAMGLPAAHAQFQWRQTEDSLGLANGEKVVWQLHFKKEEGKPYFHPVNLADGTTLTLLRPPDHPWHRGLWFSWKLINGVNYWEEDKNTGLSEGLTELVKVATRVNPDFSATVNLDLSYHPPGKAPVMTEKRVLSISAPDSKGNYSIDWDCVFTAGAEDLKLDRTVPYHWSGGYAGLGLRMPAGLKNWTFTSSEGIVGATNNYGKSARWLDFSKGGGVAMFDNPQNLRYPTPWYPNTNMPWLTPAPLFNEPYLLAAGKTLHLRYRVLVHSENLDKAAMEARWTQWCATPKAKRVLVYTRNGLTLEGKKGFVHDNIASSVAAIQELGRDNGFGVDASEDPNAFTDDNLKQYDALVFANSNNEILETEAQKAALQHYIHAGGGFVGIHSACGSMRQWPWFWAMLGGTFDRHPTLQPFTLKVVDHTNPSTAFLKETWQWTDEFYYVKQMPPDLHILLAGDLSTLNDPAKPKDKETQPLAWCHEFEGGRCWYTALGHKQEHYSDPDYRRHILGGILWAMGEK